MILKGNRDGVSIIIDEREDIDETVSQLRAKLKDAGDFFRGAAVRLEVGGRELSAEERRAISAAVQEFGIQLKETHVPDKENGKLKSQVTPTTGEGRGTQAISDATLLLRRTVRSGQRIEYDGNVVVMGDVNAGAVITCTGDIIVLGSLRGVAHAGAEGNEEAIVMAFRLEPTQLRIAHYISRSPDETGPGPKVPEEARIKDGMIVIEAYVP